MTFSRIVIWLIFYSVVGWIYETILCSIKAKKFINRGFLNGPYCPIYGFGALLDIILIGWIENPVLLFLAGALITCTLEYITSYLLEVCFHARWWDYSHMKFNINGRVSLAGALVFGLFSVVLIKYIHPAILLTTNRISDNMLFLIAIILLAGFLFDVIYTIKKMADFNIKLQKVQQEVNENIAVGKELIEEKLSEFNELKEEQHDKIKELQDKFKLNYQERRWIKSFPKFKSTKYVGIVAKIRDYTKLKGKIKK